MNHKYPVQADWRKNYILPPIHGITYLLRLQLCRVQCRYEKGKYPKNIFRRGKIICIDVFKILTSPTDFG